MLVNEAAPNDILGPLAFKVENNYFSNEYIPFPFSRIYKKIPHQIIFVGWNSLSNESISKFVFNNNKIIVDLNYLQSANSYGGLNHFIYTHPSLTPPETEMNCNHFLRVPHNLGNYSKNVSLLYGLKSGDLMTFNDNYVERPTWVNFGGNYTNSPGNVTYSLNYKFPNTGTAIPYLSPINSNTNCGHSLTWTATSHPIYAPCTANSSRPAKESGLSDMEEGIIIYPNPATDVLRISGLDASLKNLTVDVLNLVGQVSYSRKLSSTDNGSLQLSLPELNAGIYFVRISSKSQVIKLEKIVKE